jgi:hypothetical protein
MLPPGVEIARGPPFLGKIAIENMGIEEGIGVQIDNQALPMER